MSLTTEFGILELVQAPNFSLNKQLRTRFALNWYFETKTNKINCTVGFCIFELVQVPNFSLNEKNFDFLDQISPERLFPVESGKKEHRHGILHIQISLGTKFYFKLTILIFGLNLLKKDISGLKQKNHSFACAHGCYLLY